MCAQQVRQSKTGVNLQQLELIRQNSEIEDYVTDFLRIWITIHEQAKGATTKEIIKISENVLNSHVLPFYEKYSKEGNLVKQDGWLKNYASIGLKWERKGGFFLPLKLVVYEIAHHNKGLLDRFLNGLMTKEIKGERGTLYNYLFPILFKFSVKIDDVDILILKAYQALLGDTTSFYRVPSKTEFAQEVDLSPRTALRHLEILRVQQIVNSMIFVDMGRLGYETSMLVHSNPFPKEYEKYLLFSSDLTVSRFSIVQIPYHLPKQTMDLFENLDLVFSQQLTRRISNWNLTGLSSSEEKWIRPPPFLYSDPEISIITPSPVMDNNLLPSFDTFRKLTPVDIKILDYFITTGVFRSVNQFSKAINVSAPRINRKLEEYTEKNLLTKTYQFFNLGLDLSVMFFISDENTNIPWIQHLLSFPKIDVLFREEERPHYYFGYMKLPLCWIVDFVKKVDQLKDEDGVKIYYKIASPKDYFKWGISLKETYEAGKLGNI